MFYTITLLFSFYRSLTTPVMRQLPWHLQRRHHGWAGSDEAYPNGHGCAKGCRRLVFVFIICCCFFARLFSASTPRALWLCTSEGRQASEDWYLLHPRRRRCRTTKDKLWYRSRDTKHRPRFVIVLLRVFLTTTISIPLIRTSLQYHPDSYVYCSHKSIPWVS